MTELFINKKTDSCIPSVLRGQVLVVFINRRKRFQSLRHSRKRCAHPATRQSVPSLLPASKAGNDWATCPDQDAWSWSRKVIVCWFFLFHASCCSFPHLLRVIDGVEVNYSSSAVKKQNGCHHRGQWVFKVDGWAFSPEKRWGKREERKETNFPNCFWALFNGSVRPTGGTNQKETTVALSALPYHSGIARPRRVYMYGSRENWIALQPLFWFSVVFLLFFFPRGLPVSDE